jgi:hypothetical protein
MTPKLTPEEYLNLLRTARSSLGSGLSAGDTGLGASLTPSFDTGLEADQSWDTDPVRIESSYSSEPMSMDYGVEETVPSQAGGVGTHPWLVTVANGDGGLVASMAADSLFFKNFTDWTTTPIIGYSETTGTTANVALGAHISLKLSMDENMELSSVELDVGNLEDIGATLDGDYYVLAQETPDYAEMQYIPIARIVDDGNGNPKVIQYIRNHIRLGIIAANGLLLYHPIAS